MQHYPPLGSFRAHIKTYKMFYTIYLLPVFSLDSCKGEGTVPHCLLSTCTSALPSQILCVPHCYLPKLYYSLTVYPCSIPYAWLLNFDHVGYVDQTELSNAKAGVVSARPHATPIWHSHMPRLVYSTPLKTYLEPCLFILPSL